MNLACRLSGALGLAALVLSSSTSTAAPTTDSRVAAFRALLAEQWQHTLEANPESATILGDRRYNDRWADASLAHIKTEHAATIAYLKRFGLVTDLCRSPISLCHLGLECEGADAEHPSSTPNASQKRALNPRWAASATAMTVRRCMQSGRSDPCLRLTTCHGVDLSALQAAPEASRNVT